VASTRCFTLTWSSLLGKLDRFVNMSCKYGTDLTTSQSLPGIPISRRRLIAPPHTAESSHRLLTADSSPPTPHRPLLDADSSLPTPRRRLLSALADKVPRTLPSPKAIHSASLHSRRFRRAPPRHPDLHPLSLPLVRYGTSVPIPIRTLAPHRTPSRYARRRVESDRIGYSMC
jgi:hypothetical protein